MWAARGPGAPGEATCAGDGRWPGRGEGVALATPPANEVGRAVAGVIGHLAPGLPGSWVHDGHHVTAGVTGVTHASMNGAWVTGPAATPAGVSALLDRVDASGVAHCLQVRPGGPDLTELAADRGMHRGDDIPLMVRAAGRPLPAAPPGVRIRRVAPVEAAVHVAVAAVGFGIDGDVFAQMSGPGVLALAGVACYVAEVDGAPVATAMGIRRDAAVGVFNVATLPQHRRRGHGAAITARVVADGYAAGAEWAWLQSSAMGQRVYERLGFAITETWHSWVAATDVRFGGPPASRRPNPPPPPPRPGLS